ncbi:MAG: hydrogenase iron-sulfur subunit [Candidatus Hodarchaeota archaeon]
MNIYAALAHPLREKILRILDAERLITYNDLMKRLGLKKTGLFNYHLKKLEGFIEKRNGLYQLSAAGGSAIRLMIAKDQLMAGESIDISEADSRGAIFRIGVIICTCGEEIRQTINVGELVEKVNALPFVERTMVFQHLCLLENVAKLKEWCERHFLNNLVIAACSPRLHSQMFTTIRMQLELPVEFTNIREQCAWVHKNKPEQATEKALLLIRASVAMLRHRVSIPKRTLPIRKSVAIIGGGLAGLEAAKVLAQSNHSIVLLERQSCLGGIARRWERIYGAIDCGPCMIAEDVSSVILSGKIRILTNTELTDISGTIGNYEITATQQPRYVDLTKCIMCGSCTTICPESRPDEFEFNFSQRKLIHIPCPAAYPNKPVIDEENIDYCRNCRKCEKACPSHAIDLDQRPETKKFSVGAIVLATGAEVCDPKTIQHRDPIQYNPSMDIITSSEFERMLAPDGPTGGSILRQINGKLAKSIVILQCQNSINACSHYCCNVALKFIDVVKHKAPNTSINIIYEKSRIPPDRNIFIPEDPHIHFCEEIKVIHRGRKRFIETGANRFPADLIVLNMGMAPGDQQLALRTMTNFSLDRRGFLDPQSLSSGIWACGSLTGPKSYSELVTDSRNVALEVLLLLEKDNLPAGDIPIQINQEKCGLCNLCLEVCPFKAISITADTLRIDTLKCEGCGDCVAICPTGALSSPPIQEEIQAAMIALSMGAIIPRILILTCDSCGYPAADNAGIRRLDYETSAMIIRLPCTGSIDANFVIDALNYGFDGVMIVGCHETACRYLFGIQKASQRISVLSQFYGEELQKRVRVLNVSAVEGHIFASQVNQFATELKELLS